ncbi:uncharacterized protein [Montipora capricornis]|uniref:uncharacterized protein isoform X2 n=1 Tax=Montipora foliosa TaxID=591990 RepID=UPI0035F1A562
MDKLSSLAILATLVALSSSFPSQEHDTLEKQERTLRAITSRRDELTGERVTRNKVLCPELGLLKHYDIDLKTSHINCDPVARKRAANLFAREFRRREFEYEMGLKGRRSEACCSPDCDWLLEYLEIDSTVVKCLDRK